MDVIKKAIVDWLREILIGGIISNLSGMFDSVNEKVGEAIVEVGKSPSAWNSSIFNMVQNLSETVMIPIAGVILAFVMTLELIQLVTDRNNLHDIDTWMFFKWSFKTAAAVLIVTNTWNIVMGIFDAAQSVVNSAGGVIVSDASIDISSVVANLETCLAEMELGPLFGLWFQSLFVGITMWALTICIFIIVYGRMIEIYLVTSIAPIPMATMMNREWGQTGQNYLRGLLALGFQAFLIIVCVAIYAVLVQNIAIGSDIAIAEPMAPSSIARYKRGRIGGKYAEEIPGQNKVQGLNQTRSGGYYEDGAVPTVRNKRDVWQINPFPYKGGHFAAFPPKLVETCLLAGCPQDGIVLDPFLGSGTTAAVAKQMGRHYIGIELNPDYCALAEQRIGGVTE